MTVNINTGPVLPLTHVIGHEAGGKGGRQALTRFGRRGSLTMPAIARTQPYYPRTAPAVPASGSIRLTANPTAGETLTINGTAITVVASGATGNQVNRGGTVAQTLDNLIAFLRTSADANIKQAAYMLIAGGTIIGDGTGEIVVTHLTPGVAGNAFTLATTTTATLSGATLANGSDALALTPTLSSTNNPLAAGKAFATAGRTTNAIPTAGGGAITPLGMKDVDLTKSLPFRVVTNATGRGTPLWKMACMVSGSQCVIMMIGSTGSGNKLAVKVDDQYITPELILVPYSTSVYYLHLPFGSDGVRRIEVSGFGLGSSWPPYIWVPATGEAWPAPVRGPRCAILADSFAEGTSYTDHATGSWPVHFADVVGWDDVYVLGGGGTGIIATNGAAGLKYRDRVSDIPANTDLVIIQASINDAGSTAAAVSAELDLLVSAVQARAPAAEIVATHVWKGGVETMTTTVCAQHDAIKALCATRGIRFLSLTEMPLSDAVVPSSAALSSGAAAAATSLSFAAPLTRGETYRFADGTKFYCKDCTGTGPYTVTTGSGIQAAQASGAVATQVGKSLWSGNGRVGALAGWGSSDVYVAADANHPTAAGSRAMGYALAGLLGQ